MSKSYRVSINTADKANISHIEVNALFQVSQLSECIDNDTKQDINHHDND